MSECLFCQIIRKEVLSYKLYEDNKFLAFLDIFPKTTGHTLVIPKQHVAKVWDYPEIGEYFAIVAKIARHLKQVSNQEVRALVYGFDIPHAHVHLLPGKTDSLNGPPAGEAGQKLSAVELKQVQAKFAVLQ